MAFLTLLLRRNHIALRQHIMDMPEEFLSPEAEKYIIEARSMPISDVHAGL